MAGSHPSGRKALFIDRDGVVNAAMPRKTYVTSLSQFQFLPDVIPLLEAARAREYATIIVTNQGQIGRGLMTDEELQCIHRHMLSQLAGLIDAVYYCPHTDNDACECRKPKPGMLLQAAREHGLDLNASLIVGDGDNDILAGRTAGCRTVFLWNEHRGTEAAAVRPDHVVRAHQDIIPLL